jgi:hypothetical protein
MNPIKKAGKFKIVKVQDFTLGETSNNNVYARAYLVIEDGGEQYTTVWTGFFTEKTKARTISQIRKLGAKTFDFEELLSVNASDNFEPKNVTVTVERSETSTGLEIFTAKWINHISESNGKTKDEQKNLAKKLNLSGLLMASMNKHSDAPKENPKTLEDIPF